MVKPGWIRASVVVVVSAGVVVAGGVAAGGAEAAGVNRRPVCNSRNFNLPTAVGGQVTIPVLDHAADPDVTPVRLVSVSDRGWPRLGTVVISDNGTPHVPNDDVLVFTRTENIGTASLYWGVSNVPPPENG